jgi:hypothetical protein
LGTRDRTALGKPLVSEEVRKQWDYNSFGKKPKENTNSKQVELPNINMPHIVKVSTHEPLNSFLKK